MPWLILILLLGGCGTMDVHNPYEQSISEAIAPDMFDVNFRRDNRRDDITSTDFKFRWLLK